MALRGHSKSWLIAPAIALGTFILSWSAAFPPSLVESWFSRRLFPRISWFFASIADGVPFAWLDVLLGASLLFICFCLYRRNWRLIVVAGSTLYLIFFWSWGINYHRLPLATKLAVDLNSTSPVAMTEFTKRAAREINTLFAAANAEGFEEQLIRAEAVARVARVVEELDGTSWEAASQVKTTVIANLWFRVAGIDGLFDPIVHEPIIARTILDIEKPFVIAHELAHVRGYPDEGDANFVALLATLVSESPAMRYSGWLHLWLYLRTRELDALLESGPRNDLLRMFERSRREQIVWISNLQAVVLDWFLKANSVSEGVRSYSRVVVLAAGTQETWDKFR